MAEQQLNVATLLTVYSDRALHCTHSAPARMPLCAAEVLANWAKNRRVIALEGFTRCSTVHSAYFPKVTRAPQSEMRNSIKVAGTGNCRPLHGLP